MHKQWAKHGILPQPEHAHECDDDCACRGDVAFVDRYRAIEDGRPGASSHSLAWLVREAVHASAFIGTTSLIVDEWTGEALIEVDGMPGAYDAWRATREQFETIEDYRATYPKPTVRQLVATLPAPTLQPCEWRNSRDPHCRCFRCFALHDRADVRFRMPGARVCDCQICQRLGVAPQRVAQLALVFNGGI